MLTNIIQYWEYLHMYEIWCVTIFVEIWLGINPSSDICHILVLSNGGLSDVKKY